MTDDKDFSRCKAVADVFVACAAMVPRTGRSYDEWLHEVTSRFRRAWKAVALPHVPTSAELEAAVDEWVRNG